MCTGLSAVPGAHGRYVWKLSYYFPRRELLLIWRSVSIGKGLPGGGVRRQALSCALKDRRAFQAGEATHGH